MATGSAPARKIEPWNDAGKNPLPIILEFKKALENSGGFELKGNAYFVPDAPSDCVMVDLGDKQQMT